MAKKKNKKRKASAKPVRAAARRRPKKSVEQLISEIPAVRVKFDDSIKQLEVGDMKALNKSLVAATDIKQILHDLKDHELADQPPCPPKAKKSKKEKIRVVKNSGSVHIANTGQTRKPGSRRSQA